MYDYFLYITILFFIFSCILQCIGMIFALDGIKNYGKLKQFKGFKYPHLTNQEEQQELTPPITTTNCHFLLFGSSGSEKTSFF